MKHGIAESNRSGVIQNTLKESQLQLRQVKIKMLTISLAVALLCTLISFTAQLFHLEIFSICLNLIINLLYLIGLNQTLHQAVNQKEVHFKNYLPLKKNTLKLLPLFLLDAFVLGAGFFLLYQLMIEGKSHVFLPLFLFFGFLFLNLLHQWTVFNLLEENTFIESLKNALRNSLKNIALLAHLSFKTLMIFLIGSLLVYALNIFVYAPQIDTILKTNKVITGALFDPFFSSHLSFFIQSVGMQLTASYILIFFGITVGIYRAKEAEL